MIDDVLNAIGGGIRELGKSVEQTGSMIYGSTLTNEAIQKNAEEELKRIIKWYDDQGIAINFNPVVKYVDDTSNPPGMLANILYHVNETSDFIEFMKYMKIVESRLGFSTDFESIVKAYEKFCPKKDKGIKFENTIFIYKNIREHYFSLGNAIAHEMWHLIEAAYGMRQSAWNSLIMEGTATYVADLYSKGPINSHIYSIIDEYGPEGMKYRHRGLPVYAIIADHVYDMKPPDLLTILDEGFRKRCAENIYNDKTFNRTIFYPETLNQSSDRFIIFIEDADFEGGFRTENEFRMFAVKDGRFYWEKGNYKINMEEEGDELKIHAEQYSLKDEPFRILFSGRLAKDGFHRGEIFIEEKGRSFKSIDCNVKKCDMIYRGGV